MCHRFGQRKRGTQFVTFRFSYFDACAGPGAGRAVFVEQPRWRADLPDPGSRPVHGSTRHRHTSVDNLSEEVSNTKHNDTTSPTTHTIRSRLTKCVTCHAPHLSTSAPTSGHRSSDHPSCELATQSRRLNRRYRRGPREGRIGMCPPLECPRERERSVVDSLSSRAAAPHAAC